MRTIIIASRTYTEKLKYHIIYLIFDRLNHKMLKRPDND